MTDGPAGADPAGTPDGTAAPGSAPAAPERGRGHRWDRLTERWTTVNGTQVLYRESREPPAGPVMLHLHGFGLSGRYLLPTANELADDFHTLVPDLPGFGRSGGTPAGLDVPALAHSAASFLDDRGVGSAVLVGNSMGCPVICEFAHLHPDRISRAVLVSPAGGLNNQPLRRAISQITLDGVREPATLMPVAMSDYLRFGVPKTRKLFQALTRYPTLERLLALRVPTLVVIGNRDPLMPSPGRIREIATETENHVLLVVVHGAAHALNFSHPAELAHAIRLFMSDQRIVDEPTATVRSSTYEIYRECTCPTRRAAEAVRPPERSTGTHRRWVPVL